MNCLILLFRAYYYGLVTDVYIIIILDVLYSKKIYTMFNDISERSAVRYWNNPNYILLLLDKLRTSCTWKFFIMKINKW